MGRFNEAVNQYNSSGGGGGGGGGIYLSAAEKLALSVDEVTFNVLKVTPDFGHQFNGRPSPRWALTIVTEDDEETERILTLPKSDWRDKEMEVLMELVTENTYYGPMVLEQVANPRRGGRPYYVLKDYEEPDERTQATRQAIQQSTRAAETAQEPSQPVAEPATRKRGRPPKQRAVEGEMVDTNPVHVGNRSVQVRDLQESGNVVTASERPATARELVHNPQAEAAAAAEPLNGMKAGQWAYGICEVCGNRTEGAVFMGADGWVIPHTCPSQANRLQMVAAEEAL